MQQDCCLGSAERFDLIALGVLPILDEHKPFENLNLNATSSEIPPI
jgi:hypothetical protein